ncbi:redox-sensing transcriptional repressor [Antricoccus suffuscus]|uniref:Redox-sensing transcriptional repressor Rex n=1 Tax=Antricoccus suffuscus TaxID=1629062 RepID=A0A2T0ZRY1_9ACTN|nr:redox-sensing transcriptional repressor Rex [Antricoccus suffuscus]PRZ39073.1 redox-sensing transcriptional repressor [Antricoccus suffuscus]
MNSPIHRTSRSLLLSTVERVPAAGTLRPGQPLRQTQEARGRTIPEATVGRLATYLRVIDDILDDSEDVISSDGLARVCGVNSAKLRKDLSFLGSFGIRGVGYDLVNLRARIAEVLGVTEHRDVVIVGLGNLGHALAGYAGLAARGFRVAALFDIDDDRLGERVGAVSIRSISELRGVVGSLTAPIGVIATPALAAQEVADLLLAAGVTSILNFAPAVLTVPCDIDVRKVDLASELQILSFLERRKSGNHDATTAREAVSPGGAN